MATGEVAKPQLDGLVTEVTAVPSDAPARDLCIQRTFGVIALGPQAGPGAFSSAVSIARDAEATSTYSVRTRATIYRCQATECARALLSFTTLGTDRIPLDPVDLHVEVLSGTPGCANPDDPAD